MALPVALYNLPTYTDLLGYSRDELMDPAGLIWSDTTLELFIDDWQVDICNWIEPNKILVQQTLTGGATTLQMPQNFGRLGEMTYMVDGLEVRLPVVSKEWLDANQRWWRWCLADTPSCAYFDRPEVVILWPYLTGSIPVPVNFYYYPKPIGDQSYIVPVWAQFSCQYYVAYRAYMSQGPRHDVQKAAGYKSLYEHAKAWMFRMRDHHWPRRAWSLKGPTRFEKELGTPSTYAKEIQMPGVIYRPPLTNDPVQTVPNGTTTLFQLQQAVGQTVLVFENGLGIDPNKYSATGNFVAFTTAPLSNTDIQVWSDLASAYPVLPTAATGVTVFNVTPLGAMNGVNQLFYLPNGAAPTRIALFYNGVLLAPGVGYSYSNGTATMSAPFIPNVTNNDIIQFAY
jgi:hypothetical protein